MSFDALHSSAVRVAQSERQEQFLLACLAAQGSGKQIAEMQEKLAPAKTKPKGLQEFLQDFPNGL